MSMSSTSSPLPILEKPSLSYSAVQKLASLNNSWNWQWGNVDRSFMVKEREALCLLNQRLGAEDIRYREALFREKNEKERHSKLTTLSELKHDGKPEVSNQWKAPPTPVSPASNDTKPSSARLRGIKYWSSTRQSTISSKSPMPPRNLKPTPSPELLARRSRSSCIACSNYKLEMNIKSILLPSKYRDISSSTESLCSASFFNDDDTEGSVNGEQENDSLSEQDASEQQSEEYYPWFLKYFPIDLEATTSPLEELCPPQKYLENQSEVSLQIASLKQPPPQKERSWHHPPRFIANEHTLQTLEELPEEECEEDSEQPRALEEYSEEYPHYSEKRNSFVQKLPKEPPSTTKLTKGPKERPKKHSKL